MEMVIKIKMRRNIARIRIGIGAELGGEPEYVRGGARGQRGHVLLDAGADDDRARLAADGLRVRWSTERGRRAGARGGLNTLGVSTTIL